VDEGTLEKTQPTNQPDIVMLKKILQFLLPRVGTSLCSNPLLSLLSLEWANTELALGLEFESLWKVNLTSSNIIILFCDCFTSYDASPGFEVDLGEIENLVIPAIQHVESHSEQQWVGRNRLQEIISIVLKFGHALDWVSTYGGNIARLFTSGPDEKLLECCLQRERSSRNTDGNYENQSGKVPMTPNCECEIPWLIDCDRVMSSSHVGMVMVTMAMSMAMTTMMTTINVET
jgi:hypothetical protein